MEVGSLVLSFKTADFFSIFSRISLQNYYEALISLIKC